MIHKSDNTIKRLTLDFDIRQVDIRTAYFELHEHKLNKDRFKRLYHMPDDLLGWRSYFTELYAIDSAVELARCRVLGVDTTEDRLIDSIL